MPAQPAIVASPVAHLIGPGKLNVHDGRLAFVAVRGNPLGLDPQALRALWCYGPVSISDRAMNLLLRRQIQVAWLSRTGQVCHARLVRPDASATALRVLQHRLFSQPDRCLQLARQTVNQKIQSQIDATRHYQRHGHHPQLCAQALTRLAQYQSRAQMAPDLPILRGLEGASTRTWFTILGKLLNPPFVFQKRRRRPPPDPVNAMLSLGYTLLFVRTLALCQAEGLETALGTLHAYRPGRPSLACDLMEPMRLPVVDRWVIKLCNQGMIRPQDFADHLPTGGVRLTKEAFPRVLQWWEQHWVNHAWQAELDRQVNQTINQFRQMGREPEAKGYGRDE